MLQLLEVFQWDLTYFQEKLPKHTPKDVSMRENTSKLDPTTEMPRNLPFISNQPSWMSRSTAAGHLYVNPQARHCQLTTSASKQKSYLQVAPVQEFPGSYCWTFSLWGSIIGRMKDNVLDNVSSDVGSEDDFNSTCGYEVHYTPHTTREHGYVQK
jgi:hypothetical protein